MTQDVLDGMPEPLPPTPPEPTFYLGQHVTWDAQHELHRVAEQDKVDGSPRWHKRWRPYPWSGPRYVQPVRGIVVGLRTLSDGQVHYGYDDEPTTFTAETYFKAVLVVRDLRHKPALLRPDDLTDGW